MLNLILLPHTPKQLHLEDNKGKYVFLTVTAVLNQIQSYECHKLSSTRTVRYSRKNDSWQPDVTLKPKKANFGRGRFLFEVNFEQPEHRKHPYFCTLNCSRLNVVSLVKADLHITNGNSVKLDWPMKQLVVLILI